MSNRNMLSMRCPSDHDQTPRPFFNQGEIDFRICPQCGLVFREHFPTATELDEIYRQALAKEKIESSDTPESPDYAIAAYGRFLAKSLLRPGMRVLDFGAATGALVEYLRGCDIVADGVELSPEARARCATQRGFALNQGLEGIPAGSYNAVTMIEVIEHLTDLSGTLRALLEILEPGGVLFITTPNRRSVRARLEGGYWREATKKFHLFLFDQASLSFHLRTVGFGSLQRIVFSPVQKPGFKSWLLARLMSCIGMSGTLCVVVRRDGQ